MNDNRRSLTGAWAAAAYAIAAMVPVVALVYALHLLPELGIIIYKEQFLAFFLTLCMVLTFIVVPAGKRAAQDHVPWYDMALILLALAAGGYTSLRYHVLVAELGVLSTDKVLASAVGIALLLEATRRHAGWAMVCIGAGALAYAYFGHTLTGLFETRVIRADRLVLYNYMGQDAIHGIPLLVAATIVTAFMLFGQILFDVGGGKAISDFAFSLMGRRRGGPAKVSVVASALFGSLSGSASANVATTGMVTIPMMKDIGYPAHKAAAIEAVASTGGLILPPIMAATGFIMAEFLAIPYATVALAALLPALLYYACILIQVDLEAARSGMTGLPASELPPLGPSLIAVAPIAFPVVVLLYTLFGLSQSPETAAFLATAATLLVSLSLPAMRRGFRTYLSVLAKTGESVVYVAIICAIAGLVMGCLGLTGLGSNLSQKLVQVAGGNVWLLLVLAALGSVILGMGVPVTATYIILVILVGPALVQAGVDELAAHLFVFYFGTLSFLTPPVCISVFVAAAIAKSHPMRTALVALRLAIVAYILPFLFVFNEGYLLHGGAWVIGTAVVGSLAGVFLLSVALVGYFVAPLSAPLRLLVLAAGLATLAFGPAHWQVGLGGWALAAALHALQRWRRGDAVPAT